MDTMGVLNSWLKLLMKSFRNSSRLPSSAAMSLKLQASSPMSPGTSSASTRTEKSPWDTACMACTRSFMGLSLLRPMPAASVSMNTISSVGMASVRKSGFTSSPKNTRKP